MCGIAAIVSEILPIERRLAAVERMSEVMLHRGPDEGGTWAGDGIALGMRRLAIFDPSNGHQPMVSTDGRFTLVFNGAIYNFRDLRRELETLGRVFQTQCDTEVLLAAYEEWRIACLPRLRGMFAFAIWDRVERTLFAARDAFGIKPLYYARLPSGEFLLASELKALFASKQLSREIDPASVGEYLAWFSVPAPRTIFKGAANLPPGHCLICDRHGRVAITAWWQFGSAATVTVAASLEEFHYELRRQLEDSICAHHLADVPVGAFLSGGLDSATVVALMARNSTKPLKTFSVVFGESAYSEQAEARHTAAVFGTEHHEELVTGARVANDLPKILRCMDQPTGDGINTYYASQTARQGGVTVALSGLGGDELFGGYPSFFDLPRLNRWLPWWRRLPSAMQQAVLRHLHAHPETRRRKLADFLGNARDLHELASLRRRVLPEDTRLALLNPEARRQAERLGPLHPLLDDLVGGLEGADEFQIISAWEMRTYMADVLLRDSDVFSMAHSLELRVPLVDRVLIEWLWPQATAFKFNRHTVKQSLADAVSDLIPPEIRARKKRGFTFPFPLWMRAELRPFLDDTFSPAALSACPWIDAGAVAQLWHNFTSRQDDRAWSRVWTLAMLIQFCRQST